MERERPERGRSLCFWRSDHWPQLAHFPIGCLPLAKPYTRQYNYGVSYDSNNSIHRVARFMKRASTPQQIAPPEAENENQPVESVGAICCRSEEHTSELQ